MSVIEHTFTKDSFGNSFENLYWVKFRMTMLRRSDRFTIRITKLERKIWFQKLYNQMHGVGVDNLMSGLRYIEITKPQTAHHYFSDSD